MAASDERVLLNYERLVSMSLEAMFNESNNLKSVAEVRDLLVGRIRESLFSIFGNDFRFDGIGDPLTDGTFLFSKGTAKGYLYKNLSGGERAAFDLVLDMVVKTNCVQRYGFV